jgi:hypothetical protein
MVSASNDFLITRDFGPIVISGADLKTARVFVEPLRDFGPSEAIEFRQFTLDSLSAKVRVVQTRDDANYRILIRMEKFIDYAIRNSKHEPAHGLIVLSTCKWPIKETTSDCENMTYYYFADFANAESFHRVYRMWMDYVLPPAVHSDGDKILIADGPQTECPTDNSSIAPLTRQAFDEGRKSEGLKYGKLISELVAISRSNESESEIINRSIAALTDFEQVMKKSGYDVSLGDIIIHRETELKSVLRVERPIAKARYGLQLAVIEEIKRMVCRR